MDVMNAKLQTRIDEMRTVAEENGWTVQVEPHEVEGIEHAVAFGAAREIDGYEFMCFTSIAINPNSGRIITLVAPDIHDARIVVEVEKPTVEGRGGKALGYQKPYWWSKRADAWRALLINPMDWCHLVS